MGDILASSPEEAIIDGVYLDELTVTYDAPKPKKILFTEEDLYKSDLFGFGSQIGAITNKSTSAYAMLPILKAKYGEDSAEYKLTISRLQQCCVAQGREIDKTKIGQKVKGIPKAWTTYHHIEDGDSEEAIAYKNLMNRILIEKHPYFFRYRYPDDNKVFVAYHKEKDSACQTKFGLTIEQLIDLPNRNETQEKWVKDYYRYCPLIISDSPMNMLCRYVEGLNVAITKKVKDTSFDWSVYEDPDVDVSDEDYEVIVRCYQRHQRDVQSRCEQGASSESEAYLRDLELLKEKLYFVSGSPRVCANALLKYVYGEHPSASKRVAWDLYGYYYVQAARKKNPNPILFPVEDEDGEIEYLGKRYSMREVEDIE